MSDRIEVLKTYKTYVGGAFPRSESGKTFPLKNSAGSVVANICRCTRKDVRDATGTAKSAVKGWSSRSAYNSGQILYRIAEMLEGRKEQFVKELQMMGMKPKDAEYEVSDSVDRLIYFAGWTDKYPQVFGSVNPVASKHFNFTAPEPTGLVAIIAPDESPLLGLVSMIAPVIAGGNSCVVLASETNPMPAVSFGEVLHSSDLPGGVVNILTGYRDEMADHLTKHMDVNAIFNASESSDLRKLIDENASISIKRVCHYTTEEWDDDSHENPYLIMEFQENKTTWHPAGT
jgi:acyl-CoA reductase-like NAD-dependent aldehyde dehydrogenase